MFDPQPGNCKKRSIELLRILRKDRHRPALPRARPMNNHHILRRRCSGSCAGAAKSPTRELRITKKERVANRQFRKKTWEVAPTSKKIGSPSPPTSRTAEKLIGPTDQQKRSPPPLTHLSRNPAKGRDGARCITPILKIPFALTLSYMTGTILVEIVGLKSSECSPFPCDENRTCGLSECYPSGNLVQAFDALKAKVQEIYGNRVEMKLTLIDDDVPDHIRSILEKEYP